MPRGGARVGAGRPKDFTAAAEKLAHLRDKMQEEFTLSASELAGSIVTLTKKAIEQASAGDKNMLRFLLEHYWKIVGALPVDNESKYQETAAAIRAVISAYERPQALGADSSGDPQEPESVADAIDGGTVLRPV